MSTTLPATPPPGPSARDASRRHTVHVCVGITSSSSSTSRPSSWRRLLGGGTATALVLARCAYRRRGLSRPTSRPSSCVMVRSGQPAATSTSSTAGFQRS